LGVGVTIPDLDEHGLLPQGIHEATLEEVRDSFVEAENRDRRGDIWEGFSSYLEFLRNFDPISIIYLDGSYMTSKEKPQDIDVIVELPSPQDFQAISDDPRSSRLFKKKEMKRRFRTDPWPHYPGIPPESRILDLFQRLRHSTAHDLGLPPTHRKGIIKVAI
jgi:hypothetical protein